jgi:hypothetical protein
MTSSVGCDTIFAEITGMLMIQRHLGHICEGQVAYLLPDLFAINEAQFSCSEEETNKKFEAFLRSVCVLLDANRLFAVSLALLNAKEAIFAGQREAGVALLRTVGNADDHLY